MCLDPEKRKSGLPPLTACISMFIELLLTYICYASLFSVILPRSNIISILARMLPTLSRSLRCSLSLSDTFKAKKPWPPDFSKLPSKYQFRLEKRYRRRAALKWARPRLIKTVTLVQWGSIAGRFAVLVRVALVNHYGLRLAVIVYGVFFMEDRGNIPFKGVCG